MDNKNITRESIFGTDLQTIFIIIGGIASFIIFIFSIYSAYNADTYKDRHEIEMLKLENQCMNEITTLKLNNLELKIRLSNCIKN